MDINPRCRHFPGDRPCVYHKQDGARCDSCAHYSPVGFRILIIKLDALGDVLRTTCLLPALRRSYPEGHVTWLTLEAARPVLEQNPYVNETWSLGTESLARLGVQTFHLVLNPDASKASAGMASVARAKERRGFMLGEVGQVVPLSPEAETWLALGARDDLKRANRTTYQDHVHRMCGLDAEGQGIVLRLTDREREFADRWLGDAGIEPGTRLIGFNTGSSPRWPKKQWPRERYLDLARRLEGMFDGRVVLLGGRLERGTNRWLSEQTGGYALDTGSDHDLRHYFALVGRCDVVVTGDTLGLHVALALGKKVVALFGPTSPWEVDLYGRGVRVVSDLDCVCCYRSECAESPTCMERIRPEAVMDAIRGLIPGGWPTGAGRPARVAVLQA